MISCFYILHNEMQVMIHDDFLLGLLYSFSAAQVFKFSALLSVSAELEASSSGLAFYT